ncbi:MAG: DHH family phosphoesterase [Oscillospiraceae bacterium]|nr:DHH family phosphoesterase [Oscillospiraceae bacterium]
MNFEIFNGIETVYITGHRNPDADSLVSAKIMQDILADSGINAQWVVWQGDKADPVSIALLEDVMDRQPLVLTESETDGKKFLLVDHNDVLQSVGDKSLAAAAIDHHSPSGQLENVNLSDYCCTALYIYMMFRDRYDFSDKQKEQIFRAVLGDSVFGRSSRYKPAKDGDAVKLLGYSTDYDEYFKKYFVPTDLTDCITAFAENGVKSYKYSWAEMKSGYIEAMDTNLLEQYKTFVQNYNGNFLGIWLDYSVPKTYAFFKFDGRLYEYVYDCVASRAALIMPYIIETFGK